MKTGDDDIEAFAKFLTERGDVAEEPTPQLVSQLVREFRCMECGEPISREDCKNDSKGVFASIKKCPFCKSERVIRQRESGWAAERKYDVGIEEATFGTKPGKYAGLAAKRAFQSGKIKRKKA